MSTPASIAQFLQPSPATQPIDFQKSRVHASELPQGKYKKHLTLTFNLHIVCLD
jgi:hypothetical protein